MNARRSPQHHWIGCLAVAVLLSIPWGNEGMRLYAQERSAEDEYLYEPTGKRDPFFSPLFKATETQQTPDEAKTPLQRLDLGQFKLVGVILDTSEPKALVEDNSGLGYIVTRGTLIGSKGGIVRAIEARRLVVEESEVDFYGKRQVLERELNLTVGDASAEGKAK